MQQPQRTATQVDKKGLIVSAAYDSGVITPEIHIIDIKFAETRIHFERYLRVNSWQCNSLIREKMKRANRGDLVFKRYLCVWKILSPSIST